MTTLRCRPSEAEKEPILVFMSSAQMLTLKLKNGSLCKITNTNTTTTRTASAVSWLTTKSDLKEGVIGLSKWLQDRCEIKLGNEIEVTRIADEVHAGPGVVSLRPVDVLDLEKKLMWELVAVLAISENFKYVAVGQRITVAVGRQRREFEVLGPVDAILQAAGIEQVRIGEGDASDLEAVTFDRIGGLQTQKQQLRKIVRAVTSSDKMNPRRPHHRQQCATGVLLYGPAGTGKTSLRKAIEAEHNWADVVLWEGAGSKIAPVSSASQLVHINIRSKLSALEASMIEKVFNTCPPSTMVVAEIRDPNDLQGWLRSGSAFKHEIEVSIPDAEQRKEILTVLNGGLLDDKLLSEAAQKTHGYVGDDLSRLLDEIENLIADEPHSSGNLNGNNILINTEPKPHTVTADHLTLALTHIRPSALQAVFLEKPSVKWSDIGGQVTFKQRLQNAVDWPLKHPAALKIYGIAQKKGILLYGPPGCSKTMLVKALATESDYNFLAVKGAELISMYVGESERATREIFRKARAASPCIVFFDEIDSIARRPRGGDSGMLNVLTTLLNEMDGFEELKGVLVVAATNKPQAIDPALMRPGRFDNVVYIGPPDGETRRAIFEERFRVTPKFGEDARGRVDDFVERTEGLSGAEIVAVCQLAGEIAFGAGTGREITSEDILDAVGATPRSITTKMLKEYETWNAERAAG